ncbi:MAG: MarR family winged helix-turn-helix transcriptional regulator [Alphaproteobacteria bacterium]|jgi:DNA-binding MarR family transcriptional regulator|nr:MarR family winged helix-turn-helix transcriptional regulator [Alphaproteobacteria bacterium]
MSRQYKSGKSRIRRAAELGDALASLYFVARPNYAIDLSHRAIRVLQLVALRDAPPRIDDVARFLGCAPSTASELVKRLQKKDLVVRRRSDSDERVVEIELTEAGRTALTEHTSLDPAKLEKGLGALPVEDQRLLIHLIATLVEGLYGKNSGG